MSAPEDSTYAGESLGLPPEGRGSMAPMGRRIVALVVDWLLAQLIAATAFGAALGAGGAQAFVPLAVLAAINVLGISAFASTPGHAVMRLQVLQVRPGAFPLQVIIRTALLCLFVPPLLTDTHGRGLHDAAAGTVITRR